MLTRRATLGLFAAAPVLASSATILHAAEPPVFNTAGIAINGADPVAYFELNGPVIGDAGITHDWMGATFQFASAANRDAFAADPDRYAPAFGGYCAFAASRGYLVPTVPEAWSVVDDRLFLNANLHARDLWTAELPDVIAAGEANWPAILG